MKTKPKKNKKTRLSKQEVVDRLLSQAVRLLAHAMMINQSEKDWKKFLPK